MKKALAFILTMVMTISLFPLSAFAYDGEIKDFEFTPDNPFTEYFETDGWWDTDEESQDYFRYSYVKYGEGDTFTIIDNDDNRLTYTAKYFEDEGYYFVDEDTGDRIKFEGNDPEVEFIDEQNQVGKHLQLGENNNTLFIEYKGIRKAIPVTIISNPVKSFEFIPAEPFTVIENTNGSWEDDDEHGHFFNYESPYFRDGDKISVVFAGETDAVEYTYREVDYQDNFYDENDEVIPYEDTLYRSKSSEPWTVGGDNKFYVRYSGIEYPVSISVVDNTVTGIDYVRARADEYIDGDTRFDPWDETYTYGHPNFYEGDVLTVYENEKATAYTCKLDTDTYEYYFESEGGERIETVGENCVSLYDSQRETPWVVGDKNEFYVEYMGQKKNLYATIKVNPVKAIEYTRVQPAVLYDTDGWDTGDGNLMFDEPHFLYGDTLVVTYTDNSKKAFTYGYSETLDYDAFVAEDGEAIDKARRYSDQRNTPWSVGGDNEYYIEYMGKKSQPLKVTIKENDLKAIRIEKVNPATVFEGTQHETYSWTTDQTYMAYDIPGFEEGDKLILIDKNDQEKVYTYQQQGEEGLFKCGDEILDDMLNVYHYQFMNPWEPDGEYNYFYADLRGIICQVPVTVIASDVKSISFTMSKPEQLVFNEDEDGEWKTENGKRYFAYTWQNKDFIGSELTLTYKDNSTDVYTLKWNNETNEAYFENGSGDILTTSDVPFWDEQAQEPWTPSAQGRLLMRYKGATCEVPVVIRHTYQKNVVPPTCTEKGRTEYTCTACGDTYVESYSDALGHKWDSGKVTKAATYTATGVKTYTCTVCGQTKTETLAKLPKKANTLTLKAKKPSVKYSKLKKKNQTIALKNAISVSKAKGTVTYTKSSGNKKITVSKAGKITVKKGLKKGTYKVKIIVTAAGNSSYKSGSKTVTVTIKVK